MEAIDRAPHDQARLCQALVYRTCCSAPGEHGKGSAKQQALLKQADQFRDRRRLRKTKATGVGD
jgi:hypothetical protein